MFATHPQRLALLLASAAVIACKSAPPTTPAALSVQAPAPHVVEPPSPADVPASERKTCQLDVVHLSAKNQAKIAECHIITGNLVIQTDDLESVELPLLEEVGGSVSLRSPSVSSLKGLTHLRRVEGPVWINDNPELVNLEGLEQLQDVRSLTIDNNVKLQSVEGLASLRTVTNTLTVTRNPLLKDLKALHRLETAGNLTIEDNGSLEHLFGVSTPLSATGNLKVHSNAVLEDVSGLEQLRVVGGVLTLLNNPRLHSLNGLRGLLVANRWITISGTQLENLDGLASLKVVGNRIQLSDNPELRSLAGLSQVSCLAGPIEVNGSPLLSAQHTLPRGSCWERAGHVQRLAQEQMAKGDHLGALALLRLSGAPSFEMVEELLLLKQDRLATHIFTGMLLAERATALRKLEEPRYGRVANDAKVQGIVKDGTPPWLAECLAQFDETGKLDLGVRPPSADPRVFCSPHWLLPVDLDSDGRKEFFTKLPWEDVLPNANLEEYQASLFVVLRKQEGRYLPISLPSTSKDSQLFALALGEVIGTRSVALYAAKNSGSHQTSVDVEGFAFSEDHIQSVWSLSRTLEGTCLADECDSGDDYNGSVRIWLGDILGDASVTLIVEEVDDCDPETIRYAVTQLDAAQGMVEVSEARKRRLLAALWAKLKINPNTANSSVADENSEFCFPSFSMTTVQ